MNYKECNLNKKGNCECYLKPCKEIKDCAPKLIMERNMKSINKIINERV
jgi:hypothetical protein